MQLILPLFFKWHCGGSGFLEGSGNARKWCKLCHRGVTIDVRRPDKDEFCKDFVLRLPRQICFRIDPPANSARCPRPTPARALYADLSDQAEVRSPDFGENGREPLITQAELPRCDAANQGSIIGQYRQIPALVQRSL